MGRGRGRLSRNLFVFAQYIFKDWGLDLGLGFDNKVYNQVLERNVTDVFQTLSCKFILHTFSNLPSRLENRPFAAQVVPLPKP